MSGVVKFGIGTFGILAVVIFTLLHAEKKPVPAEISSATKSRSASVAVDVPKSRWIVSTNVNELTGVRTVSAILLGAGKETFVIRQTPSKTECFLTTDSFLETTDNRYTSPVLYRFDDGRKVSERWGLSTDRVALFYQGDPGKFLPLMVAAKRFVVQYEPADSLPKVASFDVSLFPSEIAIPSIMKLRPKKDPEPAEDTN